MNKLKDGRVAVGAPNSKARDRMYHHSATTEDLCPLCSAPLSSGCEEPRCCSDCGAWVGRFTDDDIVRRGLPHDVFGLLHDIAYHHYGRDPFDYMRRARACLKQGNPVIEVLQCKSCLKLAISVDGQRKSTEGQQGHGGTKCAGQWSVLAHLGS